MLRDHLLERLDHVRRAGTRRAVLLPVVPRHGVHHRRGVQRADVAVLRKLLRHVLHRIGVRLVERRAIGLRVGGVAERERFDQRLFLRGRAAAELDRFLNRRERLRVTVGGQRRVDVRPERERFAPRRHRERRIEPPRFLERAHGFGMVERIDHADALIEELLRARRLRGHLERPRPESAEQRRDRLARRDISFPTTLPTLPRARSARVRAAARPCRSPNPRTARNNANRRVSNMIRMAG